MCASPCASVASGNALRRILCSRCRFLIPLYGGGFKARATLSAGLNLYDVLSFDRGWLDDPAERLPGHQWLDRKRALAEEPMLDGKGFEGSFRYYDAQMYAPERLALECVLDAAEHGAAAANYLAAENFLIRDNRIEGAKLRDLFDGSQIEVRAKLTILAAGPWADLFLNSALGKPTTHKLLRSKGIHLLVPPMTRTDALTVAAGGGHFFVLPWRGLSLLGTTDTAFHDTPDSVHATESDIAEFITFINKYLPQAKLACSDVRFAYAGLRPLVDDGSGDTYDASRRAELIDHKSDGVEGLFSAIGGKWTTSRDLAEKVVNAAVAKLSAKANACSTKTTPLPGGHIERRNEFFADQKKTYPQIDTDHLARLYGSRLSDVVANQPDTLKKALSPSGDIGAQVLFAIHEEMALTLDDVVMRRTGIGQLGDPGSAALEAAATLMAAELGWSDDHKKQEIDFVAQNYRITQDKAA